MTRHDLTVASIAFSEEGAVLVTYMETTTAVRNRGLLVMSQQLQISPGDGGADYGDEIEDVREAILRLLRDALSDFATTEAQPLHE